VTVQFKKSDREDLLEALDERDIDRAYLIRDAKRPTSDVDGSHPARRPMSGLQ
jgi:hypothetical protein